MKVSLFRKKIVSLVIVLVCIIGVIRTGNKVDRMEKEYNSFIENLDVDSVSEIKFYKKSRYEENGIEKKTFYTIINKEEISDILYLIKNSKEYQPQHPDFSKVIIMKFFDNTGSEIMNVFLGKFEDKDNIYIHVMNKTHRKFTSQELLFKLNELGLIDK